MRPTTKILGLAAILIACAGGARAADDAEDEAARELLQAMQVEKVVKDGAAAMVDVMIQTNPRMAPFRDVIADWSNKVMTWKAMSPGIIDAYKDSFTADEMRKITAFYRTPEGRKLLEKMPELMRRQAQIGTSLAQAHQEELRDKIEARAKELEAEEKKEEKK
jgi:hypothetical protein